jgi:hypothetical protein
MEKQMSSYLSLIRLLPVKKFISMADRAKEIGRLSGSATAKSNFAARFHSERMQVSALP